MKKNNREKYKQLKQKKIEAKKKQLSRGNLKNVSIELDLNNRYPSGDMSMVFPMLLPLMLKRMRRRK